jgi:hypothetical protein
MGVDWPVARELIQRSLRHAQEQGGEAACGVGTDQLKPSSDVTLADVESAYREQLAVVEHQGGKVILMASRALARCAKGADDYLTIYGRILKDASQPVVLHWLGPMFDAELEGYWGSRDIPTAMDTVAELIRRNADKVDGIKVSLLDAKREIAIRRALPANARGGVRLYTGDDFNFPELIAGDDEGFSHALLGVFDPLAGPAAAALARLDASDAVGFRAILDPLVPLARHIFAAPTQYYKTGVVFLAYLSGYQDRFAMVGGQQQSRDVPHLVQLFRMAAEAGVLPDAELAARRMRTFLAERGL